MYLLILFTISEMFSSVSNKSIMLIKPSMIRALSAQAAPAAVSSSNKVRILCFGFSHNPLRFSLARETDTKITRAKKAEQFTNIHFLSYKIDQKNNCYNCQVAIFV